MIGKLGSGTRARLAVTLLVWLMLYCLASNVPASSRETVKENNQSGKAAERNGLETAATGKVRQDVDFGPYMARLQKRIKKHWLPPKAKNSHKVSVIFKVDKEGQLSDLHISQSNGEKSSELAAIRAVESAAPFDLLPDGSPQSVDILFNFDYNVLANNRSARQAAVPRTDQKRSDQVVPAGDRAEQSADELAKQAINRQAAAQESKPESSSRTADLKQTQSLFSQWTPFAVAGAVVALLLFLANERSKSEVSVNLKSGKPNNNDDDAKC